MAGSKITTMISIGSVVGIVAACVTATIYVGSIQRAIAEQVVVAEYHAESIKDHEVRIRMNDLLERSLDATLRRDIMLDAVILRLEEVFP